jgi:hypothetical protein
MATQTTVAADIAELKTDVKYIRESVDRLPNMADQLARHDERITALENKRDRQWGVWLALVGSMFANLWPSLKTWITGGGHH